MSEVPMYVAVRVFIRKYERRSVVVTQCRLHALCIVDWHPGPLLKKNCFQETP